MKVIDSSSLAKYVNREENWLDVEKQLSLGGCISTEFVMHEVGNSIWKRVLKKEMSAQDALTIHKEFVRAVYDDELISTVPMEPDLLNSSLELAIQEKITTYDSIFIELANQRKIELVTSDERQHDISKKRHPTMHVIFIR